MVILYLFIAGSFYLLLYKWKKNPLAGKKFHLDEISTEQFRREIRLTSTTLIIFCFTGFVIGLLNQSGMTLLYFHNSAYGIVYFAFSILLMILIHDTYFYWTHRLLHLPGWYEKIHFSHHLSSNPNPWTSLAFHPAEAIIQAAIFPIIVLIIPIHPVAFFSFLFYMVFMNVRGHSGFQIFPFENRINKWDWWNNSSKQHDEHHQYAKDNYGLYFTFWDKLMKTGSK
jgi:Delta7-sterol 5-desaturase